MAPSKSVPKEAMATNKIRAKGSDGTKHVPAPVVTQNFDLDSALAFLGRMQEQFRRAQEKMDGFQEKLDLQSETIAQLKVEGKKTKDELDLLNWTLRTATSLEEINAASGQEPCVYVFPRGTRFHKIPSCTSSPRAKGSCRNISSKSPNIEITVRYNVAVQLGREPCKDCFPYMHDGLWDDDLRTFDAV